MTRTLLGLAMCAATPFAQSNEVGGQKIARAGEHTSTFGSAASFIGHVRVDPLLADDEKINDVSLAYVSFDPGARSAWHTHPAGQRLVVTSGVGLTQEWGKPVKEIRPGDVVVCPAGIKHWHGAGPNTAMTHLAMTGSVDGKSVEWMEQVSDDQYNAR